MPDDSHPGSQVAHPESSLGAGTTQFGATTYLIRRTRLGHGEIDDRLAGSHRNVPVCPLEVSVEVEGDPFGHVERPVRV